MLFWVTFGDWALPKIKGVLCILALVILQIFVRFFNDRVLVVGTTCNFL
jgi:hypothetical protein